MTDHSAIDAATKRLQAALDALEAAVDRKIEATARSAAIADQMHLLDSDRARLASELDHAAARSRTLEATNREVASRLDAAMESIRSVIAVQGQ